MIEHADDGLELGDIIGKLEEEREVGVHLPDAVVQRGQLEELVLRVGLPAVGMQREYLLSGIFMGAI